MKRNFLFGLSFSLLWVASAFAQETTLVKITNNHYTDEVASVNLVLGAGDTIWGMHYIQKSQEDSKSRFISLADMKQSEPVLRTESIFNVTVVKIHSSPSFSASTGGPFQLELLEGFGNFKNLHLELDRQGNQWIIYANENQGRHDVTRAYLKTKMTGIYSIILYDSAGGTHEYVLDRDLK